MDMMSVTLQKIKEMVDVNTIVGQAITAPDGTTIIPVSKLSFGFGSEVALLMAGTASKLWRRQRCWGTHFSRCIPCGI